MSAWKQMVSAALVGTNQAKASSLPSALASALPARDVAKREEQFLIQAGALALWRRAGWKPIKPEIVITPAEPETRSSISRRSANHLRRMLRGDFNLFLPEWLRAVDAAGLRVPFEQLPLLFENAKQNRDLRSLATAVAGKRGEWLAAQNPEWNFAVAETEDLWETGTRDQRLKILVNLRQRDPAAALAKIQTTWATDPAEARTAFISALDEKPLDARRAVPRNRAR